MDRTRYTDDVLDERMKAIDENFERLVVEAREFRQEMRTGFSELRREILSGQDALRSEIVGLGNELRGEIAGVRADLWRVQHQVMWFVGALAVSVVGLLGAAVLQL